jgi:hypothetical protein
MPKRWCIGCRALFDLDSTGTLRCPACQAAATTRRNARPSSSARGLGWKFSARKAADQNYQAATRCQCPGPPQVQCRRHRGVCGEAFTVDNPKTGGHVTPRSQGGGNGPIRAICRRCNSSDGGRLASRPG